MDFRSLRTLSIALLASGAATAAHAGSVIATNLPSGTVAVVNIDATNDGAASYDGDQSSWFQPFAVNKVLTEITLGPGTYSFDLIDPADALTALPGLTSTQRAQLYSGWTYNSPWITDYFVFDSSASNDPNQPQLFCGATGGASYGNGEDAYHAAKAGGYASRLFTGPGGRYHGAQASTYTLTQTRTLIFDIPDYYLPDNAGGVSVVVRAQPTPEPATLAAMAVGGLALLRRRSGRQGTATTRS